MLPTPKHDQFFKTSRGKGAQSARPMRPPFGVLRQVKVIRSLCARKGLSCEPSKKSHVLRWGHHGASSYRASFLRDSVLDAKFLGI